MTNRSLLSVSRAADFFHGKCWFRIRILIRSVFHELF